MLFLDPMEEPQASLTSHLFAFRPEKDERQFHPSLSRCVGFENPPTQNGIFFWLFISITCATPFSSAHSQVTESRTGLKQILLNHNGWPAHTLTPSEVQTDLPRQVYVVFFIQRPTEIETGDCQKNKPPNHVNHPELRQRDGT